MDIFVKVLNVLPLLNSGEKFEEIDAKLLSDCQITDFRCVFDTLSTPNVQNGDKNSLLQGIDTTCDKVDASFARTRDFCADLLPCFSKSGELHLKNPKNIKKVVDCLSNFYQNYIVSAKNQELSIERLGASLLIYDFFNEEYGATPPELCKSETGKPHFSDFPVLISVSHTEGLVCCAFAKATDATFSLGLDAQLVPKSEKYASLKRVAERFFESGASEEFLNGLAPDEFCDTFTLIWTKKESLVKMTGEGMRAMKKALPSDTFQKSYAFSSENGNRYYISLAFGTSV